MKLTFCGAAGQVTGSCFLFEAGATRFLVDCGMFQGPRETWALNLAPFPFDASAIDFVILTHAHLDHCGLLPRLHAEGFAGPVYATPATRDLLAVMLPDSAFVLNAEAVRAAREGRHLEVPYGMEEARAVLRQVEPVPYEHAFDPVSGVLATLHDAGHILGSAFVELSLTERGRTVTAVVSGDLGQPGRPIVRDPAPRPECDVLLLESTYGDREHPPMEQTLDALAATLRQGLEERQGVVLVPAFAVGRTQDLLYHLQRMTRAGAIRAPRVFVDSPMATEVTEITARHFELFDDEARRIASEAAAGGDGMQVSYTASVEESKALNRLSGGAVIVAASGMCDGGRIRHHLRQRLPDSRTTVLFIGYQAAGTLGRKLVDGAPAVRIFGEEIPVRATIASLDGFSAHADQAALLAWSNGSRRPPGRIYLVHGEPDASAALAAKLGGRRTAPCRAAVHRETVTL
jgi:metallo-beta-lactamase family protein